MGWLFDGETMGSHVHVTVRCGPQPGQRPLLGNLVMRVEEWEQLKTLVLAGVEHLVDGDVEVAG